MKRQALLVVSSLFLAFAIWSNAFIAVVLLRQTLSAVDLVILRFIPAAALALVILLLFHRRQFLELVRSHPVRLIASGLMFVIGYNLLMNYCLAHVNASAGALFSCLAPLFTMFLAYQYLQEPFTVLRAFGALITFDGLFIVVLYGRVGLVGSDVMSFNELPFALIIMLASLGLAAFTVSLKPLTAKYSPAAVIYTAILLGSLPLVLGLDGRLLAKTAALSNLDLFALAFLAVVATILAYSFWFYGVKHWQASLVNLFGFLIPPLTVFFSYVYFGQKVTGLFALGGLVMLLGIILAVSEDLHRILRERFRID